MKPITTLALILLLGLPLSATAQTAEAYDADAQWALNVAQLVVSLDSPIAPVRVQSLKNAIIFATLYRDKADLSKAEGAIRKIYAQDAAHRKLALAALQAIGSPRAARYLADHATNEESNESRVLVATVLNEYLTTSAGGLP